MGLRLLRTWLFIAEIIDGFILGLHVLGAYYASVDFLCRML
jgi:hypothetical protein